MVVHFLCSKTVVFEFYPSFFYLIASMNLSVSYSLNYHIFICPLRCGPVQDIGHPIGPGGGGGVFPYMGYIGMCSPKGHGFSAILVINRVSIIAILPPLVRS